MSGTAPPPQTAAAVIAPTVTAGPWRKGLMAGGVIASFVLVFVLFSGRSLPFLQRQKQQERPIEVQMNGPITKLEKPVEPAQALPAPARPAVLQQTHLLSNNDYAKTAAESGLVAFSLSGNSANAAPGPPAKTPAADPDGIPPSGQPDALEASLRPTRITGSRVSELPDPRWLITQGRLLPCTQQTPFDSSLPGPVTAIIPEDIRGETGDVVLIPKGARVFGTIQHALTNGLDRLAVLWQTISWMLYDKHDMPHLYRIDANSPASSELGEAGLDGDVNHHYLKKIGGILGLSLIQGGIEYGVARAQSGGQGNTSINLDSFQSGGNQAANTLLESWIAIPDVMRRNQGLPCGIFIVRDLDIRGAYELRARQ
jgi:type IV secretion system protein VirB10